MIGDMICKLRKEKDISQNSLGNSLNLSASAIGMYEQNRRLPDTDTIIALCTFFSVSADYILELSKDRQPYKKASKHTDIRKRICQLIKEKGMDENIVASTSNIRKRRLSDIINEGKKPDATELRGLSICFNESSDFILGITDIKSKKSTLRTNVGSFSERFSLEMNNPTHKSKKKHDFFFFFFDDNLKDVFKLTFKTSLEEKGMNIRDFSKISDIELEICKEYLEGEREPSLEDLIQISHILEVTTDYLLGLTPKLTYYENKILNPFVKLNSDNKDIVIGKAKDLLREQEYEESVAADKELRHAK